VLLLCAAVFDTRLLLFMDYIHSMSEAAKKNISYSLFSSSSCENRSYLLVTEKLRIFNGLCCCKWEHFYTVGIYFLAKESLLTIRGR